MRRILVCFLLALACLCAPASGLAGDAPAFDFNSPEITALLDVLGTQTSELAEFAVDFQCRQDMLLNQYDDPRGASAMLGLMLASDNALSAAHDAYMSLVALRADPDMAPEAQDALLEMLRIEKTRALVLANSRDSLDLLPVPDVYLFLRDRLKALLVRLGQTFEQLGPALGW